MFSTLMPVVTTDARKNLKAWSPLMTQSGRQCAPSDTAMPEVRCGTVAHVVPTTVIAAKLQYPAPDRLVTLANSETGATGP